jgi:hypothetical protein
MRPRNGYFDVRKNLGLARQNNVPAVLIRSEQSRGPALKLALVNGDFTLAAVPVAATKTAEINARFVGSIEQYSPHRNFHLKAGGLKMDAVFLFLVLFHAIQVLGERLMDSFNSTPP